MATPLREILVALLLIVLSLVSRPAITGASDTSPAERVVTRAVRLASLQAGVRVVLVDPELAPDPEPLRRLDAFVVREPDGSLRPVVYLNRRSDIVQQAADGSEFHVFVLAAVIHHEARHLAGESEAEARRSELAFFQALVREGRVSRRVGERYIQLLARQAGATEAFRSGRE